MIAIVDYGAGNLRSLRNAFDYVGLDAEVVHEPAALAEHTHIVLPGVGAFGKAIQNLDARGFLPVLAAHAAAKKPLLGICLGMQMLATTSLEFGEHPGLGLIPGVVRPFVPSTEFPVPHVGWNNLKAERPHPLFAGSGRSHVDYYFVHSYHFAAQDAADVIASSDYGGSFAAVVGKDSVVGVQFHPEKSQAAGIALLEAFAAWDGTC